MVTIEKQPLIQPFKQEVVGGWGVMATTSSGDRGLMDLGSVGVEIDMAVSESRNIGWGLNQDAGGGYSASLMLAPQEVAAEGVYPVLVEQNILSEEERTQFAPGYGKVIYYATAEETAELFSLAWDGVESGNELEMARKLEGLWLESAKSGDYTKLDEVMTNRYGRVITETMPVEQIRKLGEVWETGNLERWGKWWAQRCVCEAILSREKHFEIEQMVTKGERDGLIEIFKTINLDGELIKQFLRIGPYQEEVTKGIWTEAVRVNLENTIRLEDELAKNAGVGELRWLKLDTEQQFNSVAGMMHEEYYRVIEKVAKTSEMVRKRMEKEKMEIF